MEAVVEFKHPLFQLEQNTKHNGRIFTRYPVNASENGDFNRGRKSFQANTMLKYLTRATEKTKRSWIYMEWIRRICFFIASLILTPALLIPKKKKRKKKMLKKVWSHPVDFCIRFRTIRDNPT